VLIVIHFFFISFFAHVLFKKIYIHLTTIDTIYDRKESSIYIYTVLFKMNHLMQIQAVQLQ
jgi:hypothetical protein